MRAAPPVAAPLDGGRRERMVITLLHAVAGAVLGAWLGLHSPWEAAAVAAVVPGMACLMACLMAGLGHLVGTRLLPAAPGRLRWDGQAWHCDSLADAPLLRVVVAVDLGAWMLLCLHPAGGLTTRWRVASARGAQAAWHGLRVALAAHAGAAQPLQGGASR